MTDTDLTYIAGTCSVGVGATSVVGVSTLWAQPTNVRQWDMISIDNGPLVPIVASPTDDTHLTIPAWAGVAKAGVTYVIYQISPRRFVGSDAMTDVETMLKGLNTDGWYRYVNPAFAGPTEQGIVANEGQFALKFTTGQLWIMSGGVWVLTGTFKPFGTPAPYDNTHTYNLQDVATLNGSSYVWINPTAGSGHAPPNATYWAVLASIGNTGPAPFLPPVAWLTATNYVAVAPASYVSINGASYVCLVAHTSGTFAIDLAAGKWGLVALAGLGYGGSSVTSQTPGTGSKTFALTGVNFAYALGNYVRMSSAADGTNYIEGFLTAFSATSATINVLKFGGTGAHTDWNLSLAGVPGTGDLSSINNLSELTNKATARDNLGIGSVWRNDRVAKTADYTVLNTDKGSTLALSGGYHKAIFGPSGGYDANFGVMVLNEDTGRGKIISCDGLTDIILWPGQDCPVYLQNGIWKRRKQLWYVDGAPIFNIDPSGSNNNDGLSTGATGAVQTLGQAAMLAYSNVYIHAQGAIVIDGGNNTFQEFVGVYCPLPGGGPAGILIFQNMTWKPANANLALQFGDGALVTTTNVTFTTTGVTSPVGFVGGHNHGVLDVNGGVSIAAPVSLTGDAFSCDFDSHFNINNGLTINAGSYGFIYNSGKKSTWDISGMHTMVGTPTIGRWASCRSNSQMTFEGGFNVSGANTTSVSLVNQGGNMLNVSGVTLPGGTPTPTTGGTYETDPFA